MFSSEQYLQNFNQAPETIKDFLLSDNIGIAISTVASRYNIPSKTSQLAGLIGYILVGLIPVKKFIQTLEEILELDTKTAKPIAHDVRDAIFTPVAEELAAMQEEAEKNYMIERSNDKIQMINQDKSPNIQTTNAISGPNNTLASMPKEPRPYIRNESLVQKHPLFNQPTPLRQGFEGQAPTGPSAPKSFTELQNEILPLPDLPPSKSGPHISYPVFRETQQNNRSMPDDHVVDLRDRRP